MHARLGRTANQFPVAARPAAHEAWIFPWDFPCSTPRPRLCVARHRQCQGAWGAWWGREGTPGACFEWQGMLKAHRGMPACAVLKCMPVWHP